MNLMVSKPFLSLKQGLGLLVLMCLGWSGYGQVYYNENELTLIAKGNTRSYNFYSTQVSTTMNEPASEFVLTGQFKSFTTNKDTSNKLQLEKILDPMVYPAFTLRFNPVPFTNLDRDTDNRQVLVMNGNLLIGNISYPISTNVEFFFMDKQLLFKLAFSIKMQNLGIPVPPAYKDLLTGVLDFRIDDGRLLYKRP